MRAATQPGARVRCRNLSKPSSEGAIGERPDWSDRGHRPVLPHSSRPWPPGVEKLNLMAVDDSPTPIKSATSMPTADALSQKDAHYRLRSVQKSPGPSRRSERGPHSSRIAFPSVSVTRLEAPVPERTPEYMIAERTSAVPLRCASPAL